MTRSWCHLPIAITLLLLLGTAPGCGTTTTTASFVLPPRAKEMRTSQKVLVVPFLGKMGWLATKKVHDSLRGRPDITAWTPAVWPEGPRGWINEAVASGQASERLMGFLGDTTMIITGTMRKLDSTDKLTSHDGQKCVSWNKKGKCTKKTKIKVWTRKASCSARASIQLIRVADWKVVVNHLHKGLERDSQTREAKKPPKGLGGLCTKAQADAIAGIQSQVGSAPVTAKLTFHNVDDPQGATNRGIHAASAGDLAGAMQWFAAADASPGSDPKGDWRQLLLPVGDNYSCRSSCSAHEPTGWPSLTRCPHA